MPSTKRCVFGCKTTGITIHKFPNPRIFQERFRTWVGLAGASVSGLTDMQIYNNKSVCDKHFAEKDRNRNSRLNALAIPHLHIPIPYKPVVSDANLNIKSDFPNTSVQITEATTPSTQKEFNVCDEPVPITSKAHSFACSKKMDNFKLKLKNVLRSSKFCGICLECDESMSTVYEDFEIIVNEQTRTKALQAIIDVVFNEANYSLASCHICNGCMKKLIQSYIFIENAKETFQILNNYVSDLFSKSDDIFNYLPESSVEGTNVVIVLENNIHDDCPEKREIKDESNLNVEEKNEIFELQKEFSPIIIKFKCVKCLSMLPTHRDLKIHRMKCKKQKFQCRICPKTFRNEQRLKAHRKLHLKVKCKFCQEILQKKELLDHLKMYHGDTLTKCLKCELFYSLKTYECHSKVCQQTKEENPQYLMRLKT